MDQSLMTIPSPATTSGLHFRVLTPDAAIKLVDIFDDENTSGFRAKIIALLHRFIAGDDSLLTDEPFVWAISDEDDTAQARAGLGAAAQSSASVMLSGPGLGAAAQSSASVMLSGAGLGAAAQAVVARCTAGPGAALSCSMRFEAGGADALAGSSATAATLIANHHLQVKRSIFIANQPIRITNDNLVLADDVVVAIHGGEQRHASLVSPPHFWLPHAKPASHTLAADCKACAPHSK